MYTEIFITFVKVISHNIKEKQIFGNFSKVEYNAVAIYHT